MTVDGNSVIKTAYNFFQPMGQFKGETTPKSGDISRSTSSTRTGNETGILPNQNKTKELEPTDYVIDVKMIKSILSLGIPSAQVKGQSVTDEQHAIDMFV
jgi:hypothetical protein